MSSSEKGGLSQYKEREQIGRGGFGVVYKARDKYGNFVAIKQIPKNRIGIHARDEIKAMRSLKGNMRIVKYLDDFEDEHNNYIVMEYCEHGTLRDYIKRNKLDYTAAAGVLRQLVEGVIDMHKIRFMHRDLTASNVLISRKEGSQLFVKLADFGLTKEAPRAPVLATCVGTPGYIAPQVRDKEKYGREADVYSLGAILYAMVLGTDPPKDLKFDLEGNPQFSEKLMRGLDDRAVDLLTRMMQKHENRRIKLEEIETHPFLLLTHERAMEKMGLDANTIRSCSRERHSEREARGGRMAQSEEPPSMRARMCQHSNRSECRLCGAASPQQNFRRSRPVAAPAAANGNYALKRTNHDSALGSDDRLAELRARSASRCRHPSVSPSNKQCRDCGFILDGEPGLHRNRPLPPPPPMLMQRQYIPTARSSVVAVGIVPVGSRARRSHASTAMETHRTTPTPANASVSTMPLQQLQNNGGGGGGGEVINPVQKKPQIIWPFPNVKHLAYVRTNKLGRFAFRDSKESEPSVVYEMADDIGNVKLIFEIYYNCSRNMPQRLLVFRPKQVLRVPEKSLNFLEKDFDSEIRIRSEDDLRCADGDVRLGYKRMCQFISLAKSRITHGTLRNAFGYSGFNLELKYNGTVEMALPDGRKVSQTTSSDDISGDELHKSELRIFQQGAIKLRQAADLSAFEELSSERRMKPFVLSW